ncbi:MAG: class I SAM-dependent methyltransferase [Halorhodospira sp.]
MTADQRSRTAETAAALRVWHTVIDDPPLIFDDRAVVPLLSPAMRRLLAHPPAGTLLGLRALENAQPELAALRGQVVTRARFAEEAMDRTVAHGCRQLVVLGAGLDTTGLRRPELLQQATLLEVDRPGLQAWKRKQLPPDTEAQIRFVPMDFCSDRLDERLLKAGLCAHTPLFATWLGCTYYLTPEAIDTTLAALGRMAAPGSELVLDYWLPAHQLSWRGRFFLHSLVLALASQQEPLRGLMTPQALHQRAVAGGWRVEEELTAANLRERWLLGRRDSLSVPAFSRCVRLVRRHAETGPPCPPHDGTTAA